MTGAINVAEMNSRTVRPLEIRAKNTPEIQFVHHRYGSKLSRIFQYKTAGHHRHIFRPPVLLKMLSKRMKTVVF